MITPSKIGTKVRCIITCCVRGNVDEKVDEDKDEEDDFQGNGLKNIGIKKRLYNYLPVTPHS